ncbi:DNA cytosine methyltransferase [Rubrivirga marina]|uniref:DNA (cytosine-5-)-methyltransferase n=1 Tax=Rubrivirga marina TaxID=1196024 RepID=A0A271ISH4_9BACT|nr:DNA cytosine methyltransferase [Rubrivirga marina]PAP74171.1 hypothetical protein BSZ37_21140 [Rubrivirga marina]
MPKRSASLFSNCGAGDLGYVEAGFRFEVMAELEPDRLAVCHLNHPQADTIEGDLRETWRDVLTRLDARRRSTAESAPLALLTACPPCQGMSAARNDLGRGDDPDAGSKDERNLLVTVIADVVAESRPQFVVVENVPQFLTRKVRHPETAAAVTAARYLTDKLDALGYEAYPVVVDLADFGVPQSRRRAFTTFVRRDLPAFSVLEARGLTPYPLPRCAPDYGGERVTVAEALAGVPPLSAGSPDAARADGFGGLHAVPVWSERQFAMVDSIPPDQGGSAWENRCCEAGCENLSVGEDEATCPTCGEPLLRPVVVTDGAPRLVKGFRNSSYRRMRADAPASTVTTASGRVGSDVTLHHREPRVLSPYECQKLQTFPDSFQWGEAVRRGLGTVRTMIGEAVPPLFTGLHGRVLARLLDSPEAISDDELLPAADPRHRRAVKRL